MVRSRMDEIERTDVAPLLLLLACRGPEGLPGKGAGVIAKGVGAAVVGIAGVALVGTVDGAAVRIGSAVGDSVLVNVAGSEQSHSYTGL
jgi:hypothetical protein